MWTIGIEEPLRKSSTLPIRGCNGASKNTGPLALVNRYIFRWDGDWKEAGTQYTLLLRRLYDAGIFGTAGHWFAGWPSATGSQVQLQLRLRNAKNCGWQVEAFGNTVLAFRPSEVGKPPACSFHGLDAKIARMVLVTGNDVPHLILQTAIRESFTGGSFCPSIELLALLAAHCLNLVYESRDNLGRFAAVVITPTRISIPFVLEESERGQCFEGALAADVLA